MSLISSVHHLLLGFQKLSLNKIFIGNVDIAGFDFLHDPSPTNAGGTGMYVRSSFDYQQLYKYKIKSPDCEQVWIEIKFVLHKKGSIIVRVIYRHPDSNISDSTNNFSETLNLLN